jgi:hypothetical protein
LLDTPPPSRSRSKKQNFPSTQTSTLDICTK